MVKKGWWCFFFFARRPPTNTSVALKRCPRALEPSEVVLQELVKELLTRLARDEVGGRNCDHRQCGKVSSNLCPHVVMPSDGPDLRDFATGSLARLQDSGMPLSSLHRGQRANMFGEDHAQRSGCCVEFPVLATAEGINPNAVAPRFVLVPRSPQVVVVGVRTSASATAHPRAAAPTHWREEWLAGRLAEPPKLR